MPGPRLELKPTRASIVAIVVLLVLLALPSVMLVVVWSPLWAKLLAIVLLAGCIALCVAYARKRLILDDEGVTLRGVWRTRAMRWDDAERYTFWSMDQTYLAAGGAAGAGAGAIAVILVYLFARALRRSAKNRRFSMGQLTIWSHAGDRIAIAPRFKGTGEALDRAFEELHARLRTRERDFTPFTLGEVDLHHATEGSLALADVDKIVVGSSRVAVKRRGKRRAWARARMAKVHNVMLLLEELAERGLIVDTKRDVFVPPPVLGKLEAAASRQAAMPQAKVVRRN